MTDKRIDWDAWSAFLAEVQRVESKLNFEPGEERFYRGHANADWSLLPTLMRDFHGDHLDQAEADLFFEFQARAKELYHLQLSDWDVLFFMRHHGAPTRLLDWSETLGVAMYFALERHLKGDEANKASPGNPCIWVLNPYQLNRAHGSDDLFLPKNLGWDRDEMTYYDYGELLLEDPRWGWETPLAIYPQQKPARMGAQRGWFTIHGEDHRPLNTQVPDAAVAVEIPPEVIPAAKEVLRVCGVDAYSIYADLDGLAESLSAKNRRPKNHARRVNSKRKAHKRKE